MRTRIKLDRLEISRGNSGDLYITEPWTHCSVRIEPEELVEVVEALLELAGQRENLVIDPSVEAFRSFYETLDKVFPSKTEGLT
jgi:hypothetical protein